MGNKLLLELPELKQETPVDSRKAKTLVFPQSSPRRTRLLGIKTAETKAQAFHPSRITNERCPAYPPSRLRMGGG